MKQQICLTHDDIRQIIANAFSTDLVKVKLEATYSLEGIGMGEKFSMKAKATVDIPMNDQEMYAKAGAGERGSDDG